MSKSSAKSESSTADDLRTLLHEAEQALSEPVGAAGDKFDELRARLRTALDQGKDGLEYLRAEAVRRAKQADQAVHDHPYYAVGIAAGLGAIIGILLSRSCQGSR